MACLPSACSAHLEDARRSSGVVDASSTTAPAPSPKSTATSRPRVVRSMPVECTSQPTTSTRRYWPDATIELRRPRARRRSRCTGAQVDAGQLAGAELVLQEERDAREVVLRRERGDHDRSRSAPARGRRSRARAATASCASSAGLLPGLDVVALDDSRALRIHSSLVSISLREIVVGHHARRHVHARAGDLARCHHPHPPCAACEDRRAPPLAASIARPPQQLLEPRPFEAEIATPPCRAAIASPSPGAQAVDLVEDEQLRRRRPGRSRRGSRAPPRSAALESGLDGVDHVQQQVGVADLLERGAGRRRRARAAGRG